MKKVKQMFCGWLLLATVILGSASAEVIVDGDFSKIHQVQPGASVTGTVVLKNIGQSAQEVKLYQTDYLFFSNSTSEYPEAGTLPRSNARWIQYSPRQVTIQPGEEQTVSYEISVPRADTLSGTYWSMIMVEPLLAEPTGSGDSTKFSVQAVMRYGIQMITQIGNTGRVAVRFLKRELLRQNGQWWLMLDVQNTGERWMRPDVWLELYGGNGGTQKKLAADRYRLFPGTSVRYKFELKDVPPGDYQVLVIVDPKDSQPFGAQYSLTLKEE